MHGFGLKTYGNGAVSVELLFMSAEVVDRQADEDQLKRNDHKYS